MVALVAVSPLRGVFFLSLLDEEPPLPAVVGAANRAGVVGSSTSSLDLDAGDRDEVDDGPPTDAMDTSNPTAVEFIMGCGWELAEATFRLDVRLLELGHILLKNARLIFESQVNSADICLCFSFFSLY